jgi:hypothetical protein
MATVKTGYTKTTTALKTASGKDSAARALDPGNSTVIKDDNEEVKVVEAVTQYVLQDSAEKAAKLAKDDAADVIRVYAGTVRDENALAGDYQKTLRVMGRQIKSQQLAVDVASLDKFSVPKKKEDVLAIKALMGDAAFETVFEQTVELSIKKSVMENDALRKELSQTLFKALGVEGIKKFFEKEDTWKVKKGMAEDQYTLSATVREALKTHAPQAKDSIKDASGNAAD